MNRWPPQGGYKLTLLHHVRGHDPKLKKRLAESLLENEVTREALRKKW
jgi:hypothetical protein